MKTTNMCPHCQMATTVEVVRNLLDALIITHPRSEYFREMLADGSMDRRMEQIGADVFDPERRVRAAIAARDWLKLNDPPP